jgi:DNA replication protein DnaD
MKRPMFNYTKRVLESVSFDSNLFRKELEKAMKILLPYEIEELANWLVSFTKQKPELQNCLQLIHV